jgi:hypothetical protein
MAWEAIADLTKALRLSIVVTYLPFEVELADTFIFKVLEIDPL